MNKFHLHSKAVRSVQSRECPRCKRVQIKMGDSAWKHLSRDAERKCALMKIPTYWWNE